MMAAHSLEENVKVIEKQWPPFGGKNLSIMSQAWTRSVISQVHQEADSDMGDKHAEVLLGKAPGSDL